MFLVSAILLYTCVSLLARVRPNIHVPPLEPESTTIPLTLEETDDAEGSGLSAAHIRSRSRDHEPEQQDALQRASLISPSVQDVMH